MLSLVSGQPMPVIAADPFDLNTLRDPYDFQEMLREAGPVVWLCAHNTYGVARFEQVKAVFANWRHFTSQAGASLSDIRKPGSWRSPGPIVEVDPPQHTQTRTVMNQIISPKLIRSWKEAFEREAENLCDRVLCKTEIDAVPELAEAYVLKVFPDALGIECDRDNLIVIGNHNFNSLGPQNELLLRSQAALDKIGDWLARNQTREAMMPGGFGALIFNAENEGALPPGTAPLMLRTLLRGGMDTTISGIGSTLKLLAENPDQWELARNEPALLRVAFEEALRLESPAQTLFRTTTSQEIDFEGYKLSPDTKVQLFLGAANRDPRKWTDPGRFDVRRKLSGLIAFGFGIHLCICQMIARMEAECLLQSIMRRVKRIELAGPPRIRLINALRTLDKLPLRITRT